MSIQTSNNQSIKCPDGGTCHHDCKLECWRRTRTGALTPNEQWPYQACHGIGEGAANCERACFLGACYSLRGNISVQADNLPRPAWPQDDGIVVAKPERPDWHTYFMDAAEWASRRASCPRATCGAAIVVNNHVVATGYNGAPSGQPHCTKDGCLVEDNHCQRALHAEVNAVGQLVQHGPSIAPGIAVMYIYRANVTSVGDGPCRECRKVMMAAGVWNYYTLDGPGTLRQNISVPESNGQFKHHVDCTHPRGGACCLHGECRSSECCYHGSDANPRPMDFVCGQCQQKFPQADYLDYHMRRHHTFVVRHFEDKAHLANYNPRAGQELGNYGGFHG